MRLIIVVCVLLLLGHASTEAQQPVQNTVPVDFVRLALQQHPRADFVSPLITSPSPGKRLGPLVVVDPEPNGLVKVMVPVGQLVAQLADNISRSRYQRAERKARERARQDLKNFLARQK
jgi:hypothetical protein